MTIKHHDKNISAENDNVIVNASLNSSGILTFTRKNFYTDTTSTFTVDFSGLKLNIKVKTQSYLTSLKSLNTTAAQREKATTIFLVPFENEGEEGVYREYLWVEEKGDFEVIGSTKLDLDPIKLDISRLKDIMGFELVTQNGVTTVKSTRLDTDEANITSLQNNKVNKSDIIDNVTTNNAAKVLSAKQGKLLNEEISKKTITVEKQNPADTNDVNTYIVKQNNTQVGVKINIPKTEGIRDISAEYCSTRNDPIDGLEIGDLFLDFTLDNGHKYVEIPSQSIDVDDVVTQGGSNPVTGNAVYEAISTINDYVGGNLQVATQSTNGLMSKTDKTKIDLSKTIAIGATTSASSADEVKADVSGATLSHGTIIGVYNNKVLNNDNATLNVNSLGAKKIYYQNRQIYKGEFPFHALSLFVYLTWSTLESGAGVWMLIHSPAFPAYHDKIKIDSSTSLDDYTKPGWYYNNSNSDVANISNTPFTQFNIPNKAFAMQVIQNAGCIQILYPYTEPVAGVYDIYIRRNNSSSFDANNWSSWRKIYNDSNLTSSEIVNKLDTKSISGTKIADNAITLDKISNTVYGTSANTIAEGNHTHLTLSVTDILANEDLNDKINVGFYRCTNSDNAKTVKNHPLAEPGQATQLAYSFGLIVLPAYTNYVRQIFYNAYASKAKGGARIWTRNRYNYDNAGEWGPWYEIYGEQSNLATVAVSGNYSDLSGTSNVLTKDNVINDLVSTNTNLPLSAKQGKTLNESKISNPIQLTDQNIDELLTAGFYWVNANTDAVTGLPNITGTLPITGKAFTLIVDGGKQVIRQIITYYKTLNCRTYIRIYNGYNNESQGWSDWREVAFVGDNNHTHTTNDISDLNLNNYVAKSEVVNNLTSTNTNLPLSAKQGKTLNESKINNPIQLTSTDDVDDIRTPGFYVLNANGTIGGTLPIPDKAFTLIVDGDSKTGRQILSYYKAYHRTFIRMYSGYTSNLGWSDWKEISWVGHTHNVTDITDLDDYLPTLSYNNGILTFE